jgi:hypothetical protein
MNKRAVNRQKLVAAAMATAALLSTAERSKAAGASATWLWSGALGDGNWTSSTGSGNSTLTNWYRLDNAVTNKFPGTTPSSNSGLIVFADTVFDNKTTTPPQTLTPVLPGSITVASNLGVYTLAFGDSDSWGDFTLGSNLTIGNATTTITLTAAGGGITRLPAGLDANGNYSGTTGTQTIASNLATTGNQTWTIDGSGGELLLTGTLNVAGNTTVTKANPGEIEIDAANSGSFLGKYIAKAGTTLIDTGDALGLNAVQVSATGANNPAALLTNSNVAFANPVNVIQSTAVQTPTLGGGGALPGNSTWSGQLTIGQSVDLTGGLSTGLTTFTGGIIPTGNATPGVTIVGAGTVVYADPASPATATQETYAGPTVVSSGTLLVNNTENGGGSVAIASGATLGGNGTIITGNASSGLEVSNGAFLAPSGGVSPLSITGDVNVDGALEITLSGNTTSGFLSDSGNLTLNSTSSSLDLSVSSALTAPAYVLASYTTLAGTFEPGENLPNGYSLDYTYNGNEIALVSAAVPEPASLGIAVIAAPLLLRRRRRGERT